MRESASAGWDRRWGGIGDGAVHREHSLAHRPLPVMHTDLSHDTTLAHRPLP